MSTAALKDPRTILIAGGAGGMGRAIAQRMGSKGDRIVIADLGGAALDTAVSELRDQGIDVRAVACDLRDKRQCVSAISVAAGWSGGLDVLVNAAGVWLEGPSESVTELEWDRVFAVNLKGAFFMIQAAIVHLRSSRGVIINIASDAGLIGNSGAAVYCASKGGLVLLTKALALELAPDGIRVNAVCPGDVDTPMIEFQAARYGNGNPDEYKRKLLAHYPQGANARFIRASEIARMVEYLCEPDAAPVTGAALSIDFGVTAGY